MNDASLFAAFEQATRAVRGFLVAHPTEGFKRKLCVATLAARYLAEPDCDRDAVALSVCTAFAREQIGRLQALALEAAQ